MAGQFWSYSFAHCYFVQTAVFRRSSNNCWRFFFHEFAEYLESVVMSSDKLLITGDFNILMDVPTDRNNIHYRDLLEAMGLVQHVKQPTHSGARSSRSVAYLYKIVVTHQAEKIWSRDRTTVRPTVEGATFSMHGQPYHGHYLNHYVMEGRGEKVMCRRDCARNLDTPLVCGNTGRSQ